VFLDRRVRALEEWIDSAMDRLGIYSYWLRDDSLHRVAVFWRVVRGAVHTTEKTRRLERPSSRIPANRKNENAAGFS
jgi:hypothetical protein